MQVQNARQIAGSLIQGRIATGVQIEAAFLHGSITWLDDSDILDPASDVDVLVIPGAGTQLPERDKHVANGVAFDVSTVDWTDLEPVERLLSSYHLAGSLRNDTSILVDPAGRLANLQRIAGHDFAMPEWVRARCNHAESRIHEHLVRLGGTQSRADQMISWLFAAGICSHVLLVAGLRNPTVRNRYAAVRQMLTDLGHPEMYQLLIDLLDPAESDAALVSNFIDRLEPLFDAAVRAEKTRFHFADDLSKSGRIGAIDASRQLVRSGHPRDALFWIGVTAARCNLVLAADGSLAGQSRFADFASDLAGHFRIADANSIQERIEALRTILPEIRNYTEIVIAERAQ